MRNEREDNKWKHPPHIIEINIMSVATSFEVDTKNGS